MPEPRGRNCCSTSRVVGLDSCLSLGAGVCNVLDCFEERDQIEMARRNGGIEGVLEYFGRVGT